VSFGPTTWDGETGVLNQHIFRVHPLPGVDRAWLEMALRHVTDRIEAKAHGFKATLVHVRKSEIDTYEILVPTLAEQKRIAEILSTWDRAIEVRRHLLALAKMKNTSLMQKALSPLRLAEWPKGRIADISTRVTERNSSRDLDVLMIASGTGFIRQDDKYSRFMAGKSVESYTLLRRGEFAYNKGNSKKFQFGCIFPLETHEEALVPNVYVCFRLKSGFSWRFYKQLFDSNYLHRQLGRLVNTGVRNNGLLNITAEQFLGVTIPVPPSDEQDAIAEVMTAASNLVETLEADVYALQKEKSALMQQLLTGKRRVKLDAAA